ncbi:MAG TPA: hypothetical protein VMV46_22145 [Thermoanaerobaculia bacterium]|nr:hypothetical protein [Thermoanaerobaculia bacterium]
MTVARTILVAALLAAALTAPALASGAEPNDYDDPRPGSPQMPGTFSSPRTT